MALPPCDAPLQASPKRIYGPPRFPTPEFYPIGKSIYSASVCMYCCRHKCYWSQEPLDSAVFVHVEKYRCASFVASVHRMCFKAHGDPDFTIVPLRVVNEP